MAFVLPILVPSEVNAQQAPYIKKALESVTVERDIAYVKDGHERQKLDLYVPKSEGDSKLPLVVWVHGGGWAQGSKDRIGSCLWVLKEEFALASVGYRLTDAATFPAQLEDCQAAIKWLKENSGSRGVDPNRIVVWGGSAGGHLVSLLGTTGDPNDPADDISGVIDWYGPSELLTMQVQRTLPVKLDADAPNSFESKLIGGALQENKEKAKKASPVTYVSSDDSPFLIMHGDKDPLVSVTQSKTLHAKLNEAGVPTKLHILRGAGHGGQQFQSESSRKMVREFLNNRLRSE
ncbi:alpha/beta hydrolase [Thalassoglobus neptunius]|nr:alpha/beta hydrolase [Thalassoglobus neptunius]